MNLIVKAPLNTQLGYGHAGWHIVKNLYQRGHRLSLFPLGQSIHLSPTDEQLLDEIHSKSMDNLDANSDCLLVWHEFSLIQQFTGKGKYIAFPFFEINRLDNLRVANLSYADKILVPSNWAKVIIEVHGIQTPVEVVPLGVDTTIFHPVNYPASKNTQSEVYKFFTIGKIEKRKCTHLLSDLFSAAFTDKDNVELHVLCDSPLPQIKQQMPEIKRKFGAARLASKIFLHDNKQYDEDLAAFIQSMDCGLFLTRAEGFGLPILQTMACGKPVITTDYSAQTEFVNNDNSHLIHISEMEPAYDGVWFNGLGTWAKIGNEQIEQCINFMRQCYNERPTNEAGLQTANRFTWANTCDLLLKAIQ